jgi:hypothetical protein
MFKAKMPVQAIKWTVPEMRLSAGVGVGSEQND